ncbi:MULTISPECIES: type VII secretion protein EccE [unclassified Streptomyces]|uniref:type VII secretion protein EccE n=1 Tax=unclassified Streptomyces TaxID=2593676 RepID=UPI00225B07CE|nr:MULTISPECIES: type VII secretion protein EccE [unclassified Streptomyces]MCX4627220.1 type VII secretion protein EccE [Streptomyces sp. NBC_01443]WSW43375.1 type VII secretion protein EccE [Streptomyces sp. NBC_01001]
MATATQPQTGAPASARGGVTPYPKSSPGRFGPFRLQQLVLLQIAVAALLAAWVVEPMLLIPAGVLALVLVVLAVVRRHQRSLPEWIGGALALRSRRRRAASFAVPAGTEPGLAPLVEADPALRTLTFSDRDRRPVGMVGDGTFLTAVVQVDTDATALRPDRGARPLPLALVRDILEVDGIRLESAQLVLHTQPAPAPHLPAQSMATRNYAPLQATTGTPAVRLTWIALKLDPELCPEAVTARGGGLAGAQRCVVRAADQLASRLTGAGFRATVLTEQELTAALATSSCANPMAITQAGRSASTGRRTEETARIWRCDDRRHTTYWIGRWPQLGGSGAASLPQFVALLTSLPALATNFSLTMAPAERQGVTLTGHVRVTGRSDEELVAARRELERTARGVRTGLVRLDREQVPGLLASLPLGGAR